VGMGRGGREVKDSSPTKRGGRGKKEGRRTVQRVVEESEVQGGRGRELQFCEGEIAHGWIRYLQVARWRVGRCE
jgi:hypothetical protein